MLTATGGGGGTSVDIIGCSEVGTVAGAGGTASVAAPGILIVQQPGAPGTNGISNGNECGGAPRVAGGGPAGQMSSGGASGTTFAGGGPSDGLAGVRWLVVITMSRS